MTRRELKALADFLVKTAQRTFFEEGGHSTTLYFRIAGKPFTIAATVTSEDDRAYVRALFDVLARGGAEVCGIITEGWSVRGIERALRWRCAGRPLRELPGRREVLIIDVACAAGHERREFLIDRSGRQPRLGRLSVAAGFSQFLIGLPWPENGRGRRAGASPPAESLS